MDPSLCNQLPVLRYVEGLIHLGFTGLYMKWASKGLAGKEKTDFGDAKYLGCLP